VRRKPHLGGGTGSTPTCWPRCKATGGGDREDKHFSQSEQELGFLGGLFSGAGTSSSRRRPTGWMARVGLTSAPIRISPVVYCFVAQSLGGKTPAKRSAIHWTAASALSRPTDRCPTPGRSTIRTLLPARHRLVM
jgi:hypothetical protein